MKFRALIALQVLVACVLVSLPLSKSLQRVWMKQFHLSADSYTVWYALQPFPRMYNFKNEIWYCPQADSLDDPVELDQCTHAFLNHYPARSITFGALSRRLARRDGLAIYVLRSSFGDHTYESRCLVGPGHRRQPHEIECREQGAGHE